MGYMLLDEVIFILDKNCRVGAVSSREKQYVNNRLHRGWKPLTPVSATGRIINLLFALPATRNSQPVSSLHYHRHSFPPSQTQGRQTGLFILLDHFMQQGHEHPAAAGTNGVAEGDAAAIDIDDGRVQLQLS